LGLIGYHAGCCTYPHRPASPRFQGLSFGSVSAPCDSITFRSAPCCAGFCAARGKCSSGTLRWSRVAVVEECPSHAVTARIGYCSDSSIAWLARRFYNVRSHGIRPARRMNRCEPRETSTPKSKTTNAPQERTRPLSAHQPSPRADESVQFPRNQHRCSDFHA